MKFFDIYFYTNPEILEGHAPEEIYSRVEVYDPDDGSILAYLCRVTEDQYNYMVENNIEFEMWNTIPDNGSKSKIKKKIKDKDGKDKSSPTITFGSVLVNPDGSIIEPNTNYTEITNPVFPAVPSSK